MSLSRPSRKTLLFAARMGSDLGTVLERFGDTVDRFLFVDLAYRKSLASTLSRRQVPSNWRLISRGWQADPTALLRCSFETGPAPFPPSETTEIWRRPDGSEVQLILRRDLGRAALQDAADRSVQILVLAPPKQGDAAASDPELSKVMGPKLARDALVINLAVPCDDRQRDAGKPGKTRRWPPAGLFRQDAAPGEHARQAA